MNPKRQSKLIASVLYITCLKYFKRARVNILSVHLLRMRSENKMCMKRFCHIIDLSHYHRRVDHGFIRIGFGHLIAKMSV